MAAVSRVQRGLVIILLCLQGSGDPFRLLPRDSAERKLLCDGFAGFALGNTLHIVFDDLLVSHHVLREHGGAEEQCKEKDENFMVHGSLF